MGKNVWEAAEILPMAIRLRRQEKCPPDVDAMYGEIITSIVLMATKLLIKKEKKYARYADDFLDADVQMKMVLACLSAAERLVDTSSDNRSIVNYLIKTVQSRLRNHVRDTENRKRRIEIVSETDLGGASLESVASVCRGYDGELGISEPNCRVITMEF